MHEELDTLAPENRLAHVWSTEAFLALTEPGTLWAKKKGLIAPEDLSQVEKVQLGNVFQEPIMRAFAARKGLPFSDANYSMFHPTVAMASHFDYISEDRQTLYEVKNLGVSQKKYYGDDGSDEIHPRYRAQCLHEAACHGLTNVVLVACFGGETIQHFPLAFSPEEIDSHVKSMARFWATVVEDIRPENLPEEAIRAMFPQSRSATIVTTAAVQKAAMALDQVKQNIKALEEQESQLRNLIVSYMGQNDTLADVDGSIIATFKSAKETKKFDSDAFKAEMPEVYARYQKVVSGSRRFLLK